MVITMLLFRSFMSDKNFGPSGVRALPLAAGINVGGHYKWHFGPSEVRATSGQHLGGHYFR